MCTVHETRELRLRCYKLRARCLSYFKTCNASLNKGGGALVFLGERATRLTLAQKKSGSVLQYKATLAGSHKESPMADYISLYCKCKKDTVEEQKQNLPYPCRFIFPLGLNFAPIFIHFF